MAKFDQKDFTEFVADYSVKNGDLATEFNINLSPQRLKKEVNNLYNTVNILNGRRLLPWNNIEQYLVGELVQNADGDDRYYRAKKVNSNKRPDLYPDKWEIAANTDYTNIGDFNNFLAKDNTEEYVPSGIYNPATKDYVDTRVSTKLNADATAVNSFKLNGEVVTNVLGTSLTKPASQNLVKVLDDKCNTKLDATEFNSTNVMAMVQNIDGAGTGLDADYLDGLSSEKFMKVGDTTDFDTMMTPGTYIITPGAIGAPNMTGTFALLVLGTGSYFSQIATSVTTNKVYYRSYVNSWSTWKEFASASGNVATADKLSSPVTISISGDVVGSASFDGSSNIDISSTVQPNSVNLGTDTTGNYIATATAGNGIDISGEGIESADLMISHTDTSSQVSVNNTSGNVIQSIDVDTFGHITSIDSYNLDDRYFTETEADNRFVNVTGDTMTGDLTVNTNVSVGSNLSVTGTSTLNGNIIANANVDITGDVTTDANLSVTGASTLTGDVTAGSNVDITGDLSVTGNLSINGTTTTINSTTVSVDDKNIELGSVTTPTDDTANGGGVTLKGTSDKTIIWSKTDNKWHFSPGIVATVTGNADTASKWNAPITLTLEGRQTGSVSFDGSGNVTLNTANNAAGLLNDIKTVDGSGSGLDADLLDGHDSSYFSTKTYADTKLNSSSYTASDVLAKIKTVDGSGSGLDADLLDGHDSSYFRDNTTVYKSVTDLGYKGVYHSPDINTGSGGFVPILEGTSIISTGYRKHINIGSYRTGAGFNGGIYFAQGGDDDNPTEYFLMNQGGELTHSSGSTFWHNKNMGSGSGLDADLLDGHNSDVNATANTIVLRDSSGNINGTSSSARYADLAEKYISDYNYETGTVVTVGGEFEITKYSNQPNVAGIISENPGFKLNEESNGLYVALKGKVPCKINGTAKKGDFIIADSDGKGKTVKEINTIKSQNLLLGISLEDGNDMVMVKV